MVKIIILSIGLVLVVLAVNSNWPAIEKLRAEKVNPAQGQTLIQNLQETQRNLPKKAWEKVKGVAKTVERNVSSYFLKKAGQQTVDLLKTLPPQQQEEIRKEYCGD